jgi:ABC-2 type transport system permease protein
MGIAAAAWTIAGAESEGTLEMTLANPVRRRTVAGWRFLGVVVLVVVVTAVSTLALAATAPAVSLQQGAPWWGIWSAGLTMAAMILVFVAVTFATGAASGRKGLAIAVGSTVAVVTFLLQVISALAESLEWMRTLSPWWWFLEGNPVITAPTWLSLGLPVAVAAVFVGAGLLLVDRRDLRL